MYLSIHLSVCLSLFCFFHFLYLSLSTCISLSSSFSLSPPPPLSPLGVILTQTDCYTVPPLSELETTVSGGHCVVENFTVGREGYGKVCFLGVTDVVGLDLDTLGEPTYPTL